jgi:DNA primase
MATQSQKQPKTTEQTDNQTPIEQQQTNNQTPQNPQTSMTPFSEYELRNEAIKSQAVKDAFSDARMYLECYDSHFEALKNTGITNLLQSKISEQNQQLKERENQDFLLMNPEEIMQRMKNLKQTLALPSQSNCRYLPQSLGTIMMI